MTRAELIRALIGEYGHKREDLVPLSDDALVELAVKDMIEELKV